MQTRLTEHFGIRYPLLSAPMSRHSGARLAAAVTQAGGLGLFGAINTGGEAWLGDEIARARHLLGENGLFGVGFITHLIPAMPALFDLVISKQVPVIAFSFADPAPYVARARAAGATTICQVQTFAAAKQAMAAGADILVVQGNEAGGHTGTQSLRPLLDEILSAWPDVPVLAAGGVADRDDFNRVLAAGADGAWIGTLLLATHECVEVNEEYKRRLINASAKDTIYTDLFDITNQKAFGGLPWPDGIAARVLRNSFVENWQDRIGADTNLDDAFFAEYRRHVQSKNYDQSVLYAGTSVDKVNRLRSVAEVVNAIVG